MKGEERTKGIAEMREVEFYCRFILVTCMP